MSNIAKKILIVEDDAQIRGFITYALQSGGYKCISSGNGQGAMIAILTHSVDLILLDLGLPDMDGIDIIKKVREWSTVPIIIVSARDLDKEKANALDLGADDYLTKPFSTTELLARIRVAFRHSSQTSDKTGLQIYKVGDLSLDLEKHIVELNGQKLHITPVEYSLLSLLFKNQGKVLTTANIIREVYGVEYGNDTQALRALMAGLRRKIEKNPAKPRYIKTEIGVGYRLVDE